jgi:hypothetical protein
MDKTIRRVTDRKAQQAETYRYWQSVPPGDRLTAVSELSISAYSFKGVRFDGSRPERILVRIERPEC